MDAYLNTVAVVDVFRTQPKNIIAATISLAYLKTPYKYGGNAAIEGLDCSGFVCEVLRSVGTISKNDDYTAQGLYSICDRNKNTLETGSLCFFGTSEADIRHVGIHLGGGFMIEAGGGDSQTHMLSDAIQRNAYIRIREIKSRKDFLFCAMPKYE